MTYTVLLLVIKRPYGELLIVLLLAKVTAYGFHVADEQNIG